MERAIEHLKGRFRRLREVPSRDPAESCNLIIAACMCHNVCTCIMCEDDIERYIEADGHIHPPQKTIQILINMEIMVLHAVVMLC